ncbi:MAG: hypothetical protein OXN84_01685 [Albidovulum sp.]|nr:hypothetical protein [Albidovulum sp.]
MDVVGTSAAAGIEDPVFNARQAKIIRTDGSAYISLTDSRDLIKVDSEQSTKLV